jgi:hypothetical protein
MVNMSQQKVVDRTIPVASKLVPGHAIPPVGVKSAVSEISKFSEEVEDTLPDDIPSHHVFHHKRENKIAQYPGEIS